MTASEERHVFYRFLDRLREPAYDLLRIFAGFLFVQHGAQKLFGWFGGFGGEPGATAELFSLLGLAGVLEFFGGLAILFGIFTRPVAFVLSGEMAVACFWGVDALLRKSEKDRVVDPFSP